MINETPKGQLGKYLKGDLALAERHLFRIATGRWKIEDTTLFRMVLREVRRSVEDCVKRIERDIKDDQ